MTLLGTPSCRGRPPLHLCSWFRESPCAQLSNGPTPATPAVEISVTKDGVKFATSGDIGSANVIVRQSTSVDKVPGEARGGMYAGGAWVYGAG